MHTQNHQTPSSCTAGLWSAQSTGRPAINMHSTLPCIQHAFDMPRIPEVSCAATAVCHQVIIIPSIKCQQEHMVHKPQLIDTIVCFMKYIVRPNQVLYGAQKCEGSTLDNHSLKEDQTLPKLANLRRFGIRTCSWRNKDPFLAPKYEDETNQPIK